MPADDTGKYRKGFANLAALTAVQLGNALLPLVAYPLILSVVGAEHFSRIAVTESVMLMILATVIYSFDLDGVSRVASDEVRGDRVALSLAFSEVLMARIAILAVAATGIILLSPLLGRETVSLLLMWMLFPLSYILQSAWFFQSLERNAVQAIIVVVSRLTCLFLLYWFIREPGDYLRAPLIIGLSYAAGGVVTFAYALQRHSIQLTRVSAARIGAMLVHGKEVFAGNLSVALYRDSNVLILNAFSSPAAVSLYAIAEKMVKVFQAGARPLNQLFYPKLIRALQGVREPGHAAFKTVLRYTLPQLGGLAVGMAVVASAFPWLRDWFPNVLASASGVDVLGLVAVMAISVFFGVANFMFGVGALNYLGRRWYLARSIFTTGVVSVAVCIALTSQFGAMGAAVTFVLAEFFLFVQVARAYA
jgi:PST family polysaccharide transporter